MTGPAPWGREELKQWRDSHIQGSPFTKEEISWDRREASEAVGGG